MDTTKVAVRVRPQNANEQERADTPIVRVKNGKTLVLSQPQFNQNNLSPSTPLSAISSRSVSRIQARTPGGNQKGMIEQERMFTFDYCYGPESTQGQIYTDIGLTVVKNAIDGYNSSVFTYGQTGTGKSHTMLGSKRSDGTMDQGLTPRISSELLFHVASSQRAKARCSLGGGLGESDSMFDDDDDIDLDDFATDDEDYDSEQKRTSINRRTSIALDPSKDTTMYKLEASYVEIYNEQCKDLLADVSDSGNQPVLRVREHSKTGPYVENLSTVSISTPEDIDRLMARGNEARSVSSTKCNQQSSRSHAIFTLVFTQTKIAADMSAASDTVSKINLVDLAGSERVKNSGVEGDRLTETKFINKSLLNLGRVISALSKAGTSGDKENGGNLQERFGLSSPNVTPSKRSLEQVPYRDSTLTWLLKPCLGGNSRTTMLATVTPSSLAYEETLSTLRYANQCSHITTTAVINRDSNKEVIFELRSEIEKLRGQLAIQNPSIPDTIDNSGHEKMVLDLQEQLKEQKRIIDEETLSHHAMMKDTQQRHQAQLELLQSQLEQEMNEKSSFHETLQGELEETKKLVMNERSRAESAEEKVRQLEGQLQTLQLQDGDAGDKQSTSNRSSEVDAKVAKQEASYREQLKNLEKLRKEAEEQIQADRDKFEREREISHMRVNGQMKDVERRERDLIEEQKRFREEAELIVAQHSRAKEQAENKMSVLEEERRKIDDDILKLQEEKTKLSKEQEALGAREQEISLIKNSVKENEELKLRIDELIAAKEKLESSISSLTETFEGEKKALVEEHNNAVRQLETRRERGIETIVEQHSKEFLQIAQTHGEEMGAMSAKHEKEMNELKEQHKRDLEEAAQSQTERSREKAQLHYEDLRKLREEHESELEELRKQVEQEVTEKMSLDTESKVQSQTEEMESRISTLVSQHEARIAELESSHVEAIETLASQHDTKIAELEKSHTEVLDTRVSELVAEHESKVADIESAHSKAVEARVAELVTEHESKVAELSSTHIETMEARVAELVAAHESKLAELESTHSEAMETRVAELSAQHEEKVQKLLSAHEAEIESLKSSLSEEMDTTAGELNLRLEQNLESYNKNIAKLEADHEEKLRQVETELMDRIGELEKQRDTEIDQLKLSHEGELASIQERNEEKFSENEARLQQEIQKLKETQQAELAKVLEEHENAKLQSEAEQKNAMAVAEQYHKNREEELQEEMTRQLEKLSAEHAEELKKIEEEKSSSIESLEAEHRETVKSVDEIYGAELKKVKDELEEVQRASQEALESASAEKSESVGLLEAKLAEKQKELDEQVEKLSENLKQVQEDAKTKLESEVEQYESRIAALSDDMQSTLESSKKDHDELVGSLEAKLEEATKNLESEREKLDATLEREEDLTEQVKELNEKFEELKTSSMDEMVALTSGRMKREEELQREHMRQMTKRVKEIQNMQLAHNFEKEKLGEEKKQAVEELRSVMEEEMSKNLELKHEEFEQMKAQLIQSHEDSQAELDAEWSSRVEELTNNYSVEKEELLAQAREEVEQLESKHTELVEFLKSDHETEMEKMKEVFLGQLSDQEQSMMDQLESKAHEIEELQQNLDELNEYLESTKQQHSDALEEANRERENLKSDHEARINELNEEHQRELSSCAEKHREELMDSFKEHTEKVYSLNDEIEHLQFEMSVKVDELTSQLASEKSTTNELEVETESLKQEIEELIARYENVFDQQRESHSAQLKDMQEEHESAMELHSKELEKSYTERENLLKREKRALQKNLSEAKEHILQLTQYLEALNVQQDRSERQVQDVQRMMLEQESKIAEDEMDSFKEWLNSGIVVTKHPRSGQPRPRVCWMTRTSSGNFRLHFGKSVSSTWSSIGKNTDKGINMSDVVEIRKGCKTEVFDRTSVLAEMSGMSTPHELCLSLITRNRTVDIECHTNQQRDRLLRGFTKILQFIKENSRETMHLDDDETEHGAMEVYGDQSCAASDAGTYVSNMGHSVSMAQLSQVGPPAGAQLRIQNAPHEHHSVTRPHSPSNASVASKMTSATGTWGRDQRDTRSVAYNGRSASSERLGGHSGHSVVSTPPTTSSRASQRSTNKAFKKISAWLSPGPH